MIYEYKEVEDLKKLLNGLYDQKKENQKEMAEYEKVLAFFQNEINTKKDEIDDKLFKYRLQKVISFLTFVLAFYANDKINKNLNLGVMEATRKFVIETIELIIYILPVASLVDVEINNKDLKEETRELKNELSDMKNELKRHKIKYRHLKIANQVLDDMILTCYTKITDINEVKENDDKRIEFK